MDFWGVSRQVRLDAVDEPVAPGDYILNHVGFAIRRIPEEEIGEARSPLRTAAARRGARRDLMAADVRARSPGPGDAR